MKKLLTGVIAIALVFGAVAFVAPKANAATVADLQAMIAQLQAQLAAMSGGSSSSGYMFNADLTVGSRGADVSALQNWLIGKGFGISAGATGYFGAQTKAAVSAWQSASGISPAAGYFGPKSRAAVNSMAGGTTGGTTTGGTTTGGTTVPSGISTPGVEGIVTVDLNPTPGSGMTLHEGDQMAPYIGIRIRPQNSDVVIQRVKVDLGTNSNVYTKIFRKIYLMDGSTVVASRDLTTATVTRESGSPDRFTVTLTGFQYLVPKDSTKNLTVAFDLYSSISATNISTFNSVPVIVPIDGVRATDGAGIDQYGPATAFQLQQTLATSLIDSAQLQLSTDSNTPKAAEIVAADGTANNEKDKVPLLIASLFAQKDNTVVRTWTVRVQKTGSGAATMPTVWLMDGSTAVGSAAVTYSGVTGTATFNNLTLSVPKDTTKSFTIAADVRSANGTATTLAASTTATDITAENSLGSTITAGTNLTGSASGQSIVARNIGPVFTLTSKTITKGSTPINGNNSTSTASATFTLNVQAVGGDILFGAQGSTSPMFPNTAFTAYQNGTAATLLVASSTAYDTPSSGVVTSSNSFTLQRNNSISIPVTFLFEGRTGAGVAVSSGSYAVGLNSIAWISSNGASSSTFMAGNTDWRTSTVALP